MPPPRELGARRCATTLSTIHERPPTLAFSHAALAASNVAPTLAAWLAVTSRHSVP